MALETLRLGAVRTRVARSAGEVGMLARVFFQLLYLLVVTGETRLRNVAFECDL